MTALVKKIGLFEPEEIYPLYFGLNKKMRHMEKFLFTNEGFLALQNHLYLLEDDFLEIEAQFIREDLRTWMENHFDFSVKQLDYLADIHPKTKRLIESLTSFAIENRLPITLNKERDSIYDSRKIIIWPKNSLTATSGGSIGYTASGTLEINIDYDS